MFYWYSKARVRNCTSHEQSQILINNYWMKFICDKKNNQGVISRAEGQYC